MTELDEADVDFVSAAENPAALAAAAAALVEDLNPPEIGDPLDGPVTLTAGFRRLIAGSTTFEEVRTAWVRELTGEDEERIARTKLRNDLSAFIYAVLEAGVEKLGDRAPNRADLDLLVLGDRDFLLMEIARVTYGDVMQYDKIICQGCGEEVDATLSLADEVPVKRLESVKETSFEVELSRGRRAYVNLPTQSVSNDMAETQTDAEANTVLIMHSVDYIENANGTSTRIAGDKDAARKIGARDRRTLVEEMSKRMPGPQYNEVRFKHEPGCGEEIRLGITMADLFRGM